MIARLLVVGTYAQPGERADDQRPSGPWLPY
jgi:hypothetical protein